MVLGWQHYGAMPQPFVYARPAFHEQMHHHPKNPQTCISLEKRTQHKGAK
jgi:hypothetical protein